MANQKLRDFIEALSNQAGIDTQSEDYNSFIKTVDTLEIPETIASTIQGGLLTKHSAKNDAEIASHYKVKYYKTIDNGLKRTLRSVGVTDEMIAELESEPDTLKRLETALPKLVDITKNSVAPSGAKDEKYLKAVEEYNKLQKQYETTISDWQTKEKKWFSELENKEINWQINNQLGSYKFNDSLPSEDVKLIISNKLNNSPYILKMNEGKIGVYQKDNQDLVATKNNKTLEVKDVLDELASPYIAKAQAQAEPKKKVIETTTKSGNTTLEKNASENGSTLERLGLKKATA